MESGTGTPGSLEGLLLPRRKQPQTQLLPAAVEILSSKSQAAQTTAGSTLGPWEG